MSRIARKTDPALWDEIKAAVTAGDAGGRPGQWSARKAQRASAEYKARGGGYAGPKPDDNHLQQWTDEHWGTRSGADSGDTGERYLPEAARDALTGAEYARTTAKKRADTRAGRQFSPQPEAVARKTAAARHRASGTDGTGDALGSLDRDALRARARDAGIAGRSRMTRAELVAALRGHPSGAG